MTAYGRCDFVCYLAVLSTDNYLKQKLRVYFSVQNVLCAEYSVELIEIL